MKLIYGNSYTVFKPKDETEAAAISDILTIQDPNAHQDYNFKRGFWDGYHTYLLKDGSSFPSGLFPFVLAQLEQKKIEVTIENKPVVDTEPKYKAIAPDLLSGVTLRDYQILSVKKALLHKRGVIRIPPRGGKTECQIALCKVLEVPSLLLVDKVKLLKQHVQRFKSRGLSRVGTVGGGKFQVGRKHIVATVQTLHRALKRRDRSVLNMLHSRQLIQADECHHLSSISFFDIFMQCPAEYRIGWSGTPFRTKIKGDFNSQDFWLVAATGRQIVDIPSTYLREQGYLSNPILKMVSLNQRKLYGWNWRRVYQRGIVENRKRNAAIVKIIRHLVEEGRRVLVIVKILAHGEALIKEASKFGIKCVFSYGGERLKVFRGGRLKDCHYGINELHRRLEEKEVHVIFGSPVYDEGVDIPSLDAVIIAAGEKSPIKTVQRALRGMTAVAGKDNSVIYDFLDDCHPWLNTHSLKRINEYKLEEMPIKFVRI